MHFEEKMSNEQALKEIDAFLDTKKIYPRQREKMRGAIEAIAEAMQYGQVVINQDNSITQTLLDPVGELTELKFKPRVPIETLQAEFKKLQKDTLMARTMVILKHYTGQVEATLDKLEPTDRNTAECITLFL